MNFEIIEAPTRFQLHDIKGIVENEQYGPVGLRLMDEMWRVVKAARIPTTGINYWVYLPGDILFVGVELRSPDSASIPDSLQPLGFELPRYMKHVHIGPYQELPQKWKELMTELMAVGEATSLPSLEIYGHHCENSTALETTILIGLKPTPSSQT